MKPVKNIIFDLGGVLLNLDYNKTTAAFIALGYEQFGDLFSQCKASPVFEDFETGRISEEGFLDHLSSLSSRPVSHQQIISAWNAMMLDYRTATLPILEDLSSKYNLYLLSNTNSIHLRFFREIFLRDTSMNNFDSYFLMTWYSHEIGLRKPYPETFAFALAEGNMDAEETLFIDDSLANIEGAARLGIQTHLLLSNERIEGLGLYLWPDGAPHFNSSNSI